MKYTLRSLIILFSLLLSVSTTHAQNIITIAGSGSSGYTGDGAAATAATFAEPSGITVDQYGNVYITDNGLTPLSPINMSVVRKIDTSGIITTIAGKASVGYTGDNGPATNATFYIDWGISCDDSVNFYVADQENHCIRKINPGGIIYTFAGNGTAGSSGDNGQALSATLGRPVGIIYDKAGNVYYSDQSYHTVRKINATGIITTVAGVAGSSGYSGNGVPATQATFDDIFSLATDLAGNLYICDGTNNRVRKVNTSGIVTTIAGNGSAGYNGDMIAATQASLNYPTGVCADASGNVYIADCHNNRIRKVNTAGIITTVAGNGTPGFTGDNGLAAASEVNNPVCLVMDASENIYFTDLGNERIRKIYKEITFTYGHSTSIQACQNVFSQIPTPLDSLLAIKDLSNRQTDTWRLSALPVQGTVNGLPYSTTSNGGTLTPSGLYYTPRLGYSGPDSFTVTASNSLDSNFIKVYVSVDSLLFYAGAITGPSYVCIGQTITLTDTVGNGTWNVSNLNATVSDGMVTGIKQGTDSIKYSINNNCGSATISKLINIYPLPNAGNISGPTDICLGSSAQYMENVSGGTWSCDNLLTPRILMPSPGADSAVSPGTGMIYYTVNDGFCSSRDSLTIEVDSTPFARTNPWDTTVCVGATYTITDTPANGTWTAVNGYASVVAGTVNALAPGVDTINYTIINACGSATSGNIVTVNPLPAMPVITQIGSVLYAPTGYNVYQWFFNGSPVQGSTTDTLLVANTGQYSVYVKNEYGCNVISSPVVSDGCTPADILVYPNPTESVVYIKWCKSFTVKVLCDDGKTFGIIKGTDHVDLSDLPNADYLIVLYDINGNKIKTEKITKIAK